MERKSVILIMMIFVSILSISRSLTTTEMRENTIRINALELVKVEKEQEKEQVIEAPKKEIPKKVTVVMDERALLFDFDKSIVKEQYYAMLKDLVSYIEEYLKENREATGKNKEYIPLEREAEEWKENQ